MLCRQTSQCGSEIRVHIVAIRRGRDKEDAGGGYSRPWRCRREVD